MEKLKKKHFVFDLDDTLTNSYEFNQQMFVETFSPYLQIAEKSIDEYLRTLHFRSRGTAMHTQFEEAIKHFGLKLDPKKLVLENEKLHVEKIDKLVAFDAVEDVLNVFKNSNKLISLCTNRQYGSLNKILDGNNLRNYFANVVSCVDEGHEKPDPYCLEQIIKKYKEHKSSYMYFGDSKTDYEFASNAGIDFIIIDQYMNKKKFFKMMLQAFF